MDKFDKFWSDFKIENPGWATLMPVIKVLKHVFIAGYMAGVKELKEKLDEKLKEG